MRLSRGVAPFVLSSPAKLNLFLELLGKRDDGYHEIETVMTTVSLWDDLRFEVVPGDAFRLTLATAGQPVTANDPGEIPGGSDNLVIRALERLRDAAVRQNPGGEFPGLAIRLTKRIPAAAGLGGASSNAAAALLAGNRLWQLRWTTEQLAPLAAELGSDVPFFLTGGMAVCRGRGERVTPLKGPQDLAMIIVKPAGGLSTARVYSEVTMDEFEQRSADTLLTALRTGSLMQLQASLANRLAATACRLHPELHRVAEAFDQLPCRGHQLSGSGTSYFGVFAHPRQARRSQKILSARFPGMQVFQVASCRGNIAGAEPRGPGQSY